MTNNDDILHLHKRIDELDTKEDAHFQTIMSKLESLTTLKAEHDMCRVQLTKLVDLPLSLTKDIDAKIKDVHDELGPQIAEKVNKKDLVYFFGAITTVVAILFDYFVKK